MSTEVAFDPIAAREVMQRRKVRFVAIRGVAGGISGSPTVTNDVDVCHDRDRANLERLTLAPHEFEARLRGR